MKKTIRPVIQSDWLATVDNGMQLEISTAVKGIRHPLLTIIADDKDESLWVEIGVGETVVQIPFELIQSTLNAAVDQVHSESWYDKNLPSE